MNSLETPAYVRIIGFGQAMTETILRIQSLGYDGVSTLLADPENPYTPTDDDRLIILLSDSSTPEFKSIAKTCFDADALTIGVLTTCPTDLPDNLIDSVTVVPAAEMFDVVKSILDSFILPAYLCFDLSDLRSTLAKTGHFKIVSVIAPYSEGLKTLTGDASRLLTDEQKDAIENLSALITGGPDARGKIQVGDLHHLNQFILSLDDAIDVCWSLNIDENLQPEMLKLTLIAAGPNLPL